MALGHCSHEHYPVLFEDLPGLVEEYSRTKQRRGTAARPEEVRLCLHSLVTCRQHCFAQHTQVSPFSIQGAMQFCLGFPGTPV